MRKHSKKEVPKKSNLPPDVFKFAKQMGLNLNGLEAEAEDIWSKLDDMSMNNPDEYQNFVQEQVEIAKANEGKEEENPAKMFRPKAGYSVETVTTKGDGVKIRDNSDIKSSGKQLFINICMHDAIDTAKDRTGRPIFEKFLLADGLEVPLVVGPSRTENNALVVDVVFHTAVIEHCCRVGSHDIFRRQITNLALDWVEKERGIEFVKNWKDSYVNYNGGRGMDKSTPVLFPVEHAQASQSSGVSGDNASKSSSVKGDAISNPSSLLKHVFKDRNDTPPVVDTGLKISATKMISKSKPSIQEVGVDPPIKETIIEEKKKTGKPSVKAGFLRNTSKPLYPEGGSNEGALGASGGSLARIMDKCKVINTNSMNSEEVRSTIENNPTIKPKAAAPIQTKEIEKPKRVLPSASELKHMESLVGAVDNEWELGNAQNAPNSDEWTNTLGDLAKVICPDIVSNTSVDDIKNSLSSSKVLQDAMAKLNPDVISKKSPPDKSKPSTNNVKCNVEGLNVSCNLYNNKSVFIENSIVKGEKALITSIEGLVANEKLVDIDLQVSNNEIKIIFPNNKDEVLKVANINNVIQEKTKASLSKKTNILKITTFYS